MAANVFSCEREILFTETLLKVHFILYKGESPQEEKNNKAGDFFSSMGEITGMLKCIKDNGM